ncbi:MAG: radical SAM protein [Acidobacteriota bacterium]|nr:radical SAM protein [Acidobacteriota bacterium]HOU47862.1 radical SAM protein [Candidatus Aminicenantes bacterium]MDD8028729.1 radical SAM protein [Acidobacteriota bacterium]MDD8032681.1 radical SAM protein [Acidobacteriota bacterium]MDW3227903.1 radical SAM protein [Acidobacteriota bacterium]
MMVRFKDSTADELHAALAPRGISLRLARRLQAAVLRRDAFPRSLPEVSEKTLAWVRENAGLPKLVQKGKAVSARDGFAKYLFQGEGPEPFEAVRIPLLHRAGEEKVVACLSSQVGCGLGCAFCATGRMGLVRNLSAWEMVDQVIRLAADSEHPVRGAVFMGMGEPMLNYEAVVRAARILNEPCGLAISAEAISISTAGIVPGIRRFTADRLPFRLVVSLTSADPFRRRGVMPLERTHPLPELMEALREYHKASGQRVILAWTMISGFNTREEDAIQLAALVRGLPIRLDLIDVNDAAGRFKPPSPPELAAFRDALRKHLKMPVARRYSGGRDIHAACGMLAGSLPGPSRRKSRSPAS